MRRLLAVLLVAATWFAAAGLSAPAALADQGRWKVGGDGCYWDPNDSGPDQCSPSDPAPEPQPQPEYSQDLVVRAAQASDAIQASGIDPNDVQSSRVALQAAWDASLPDDAPFTYYNPALVSQLVIAVTPPRPSPPMAECIELHEAQEQADELWLAVAGLGLGYTGLATWATNFGSWASMLVPQLRFAALTMGVITFAVQMYRSQLSRWAGGCPA